FSVTLPRDSPCDISSNAVGVRGCFFLPNFTPAASAAIGVSLDIENYCTVSLFFEQGVRLEFGK
ncbi:hypothetical protein, partial [Escherichia coli]|uniref:hypothetical protein n=1 Tax=Escherichia coli TaxID=562 RepID=UPI0022641B8E